MQKPHLLNSAAASFDEVRVFVAERVAPYKKIRYIESVDAIPRNPSGKIRVVS